MGQTYTHSDGEMGHSAIQPGKRVEAIMLPDAMQLAVIEAKVGSPLSAGAKNAPDHD